MRSKRKPRVAVSRPLLMMLIAAWISLVFACGEDNGEDDLVAPVAIHSGTWSEDDGAITGTLVEEDGCLVIVTAGQRMLPAFADDRVTWDPPSHTLRVHGVEFRSGTVVRLGGGGGSRHDLPPGTSWVNAPPDSCRYDTIWFVQPPE